MTQELCWTLKVSRSHRWSSMTSMSLTLTRWTSYKLSSKIQSTNSVNNRCKTSCWALTLAEKRLNHTRSKTELMASTADRAESVLRWQQTYRMMKTQNLRRTWTALSQCPKSFWNKRSEASRTMAGAKIVLRVILLKVIIAKRALLRKLARSRADCPHNSARRTRR